MTGEKLLPILTVPEGSISDYVLVCGDPERVFKIAAYLDDYEEIAFHREYRTVKGHYLGVEVTITSHGVGSAGAAVAFEELIKGGAKTIIRIGTCDSLDSEIRDGDLVIATGAVREDGLTDQYDPHREKVHQATEQSIQIALNALVELAQEG